MVDYDKWSQMDLSDDEDGVEVPPNIERGTWFRLRRDVRRRQRVQEVRPGSQGNPPSAAAHAPDAQVV